MTEAEDIRWMEVALTEARRGWGRTDPNPHVGAAVVKDGELLATGYHARAGAPHAEIEALTQLETRQTRNATLYVTLEPCSTEGRTPPCTAAIIGSEVARVVIGTLDPNPRHGGRAIDILRGAGVQVTVGVCEQACADLNLIFNHWITTQRPLFAAKQAVTLDGRIATREGESQWITGDLARTDVHRWRRYFPAIAVGAGTILADNPALTARIGNAEPWCPWRFVFDRRLRTARGRLEYEVFSDPYRERTVVVTDRQTEPALLAKLQEAALQVWSIEESEPRRFFKQFAERCAAKAITGVLFEGGAGLLSELLYARAMDYLFSYRAPILLADEQGMPALYGIETTRMSHAVRLREVQHASFADDQLLRGWVEYPLG